MESGNAIDDVLFGAVNPSGRLTHTIAKNETDYDAGTAISEESVIEFTEGNYIDYKYFDKYNISPRYEFGYGLSYTDFTYSSTISVAADTDNLAEQYATGSTGVGGRKDLWSILANVTATITNSGSIAGADVPQIYATFPDAADEPVRQLRGFRKVLIGAGESIDVTFNLARRDLSIWNVEAQNWAIVIGTYTLYVAASRRDIRASTTLTVHIRDQIKAF
jgi:beta-glucosidase